MPRQWSENQSQRLWDARPYTLITHDEGIMDRQQRLQQANRVRMQRNEKEEADFQHMHMQEHQHPNAEQTLGTQDAENLEFWVKHGSWTYCSVLQTRHIPSPPSVQKHPSRSQKMVAHAKNADIQRQPTPTFLTFLGIFLFLKFAVFGK